ncbi:hypothetical protein LWI28_009052 [Acer negundo]|uniref:COI1 F-box domain-containing protein n=1 Tax=Acer negundo TaxID=4023 RepID=A0AAD5JFG9_ACENE|nr:hypothetical protein LWI28_009052 [Acer negundo]KAK4858389.1 hypothetical protein QYF36_015670 [Acer negundo]
MAGTLSKLHFHEIPDVILSNIFSLVTDTRTRNAMSLVCLKWCKLERSTRTSLTLRGNIRDLYLLPDCFQAITNLDLSFLSPWGCPLLDSSQYSLLLSKLLAKSFPKIVSLTIYARNPSTLHCLAPEWPNLRQVKLVRWHQRFNNALIGSEFVALLENCYSLSSLDLSNFYCWTEDLPPALEAYPNVAASLSRLNILIHSLADGFKSHELLAITAACPNLRELLATCIFDPRFIGFVGDETLLSIASNCPHLSLLHLVDSTSMSINSRVDHDHDEEYRSKYSSISHTALRDFFTSLPMLEDLVLDVCNHVRDIWPALEFLNSKYPRLKSLKLGEFHGICRPDGFVHCRGLKSLSIKNSADLTDSSLISISFGCPKLTKFEIQGCHKITEMGLWKLVCVLQRTLIDVRISSCKNLNTQRSLQVLEPIRERIQRLHIDCVWENVEHFEGESSTSTSSTKSSKLKRSFMWEEKKNLKKKSKLNNNIGLSSSSSNSRTWAKLKYLSLWIAVGELLNPLTSSGIEDCPILEEIQIKAVGDSRCLPRPSMAFGLSSLECYPQLSKMNLDCSNITGFALTAPIGHTDLSLWERFYLYGIGNLNLIELNYWPPQDIDVNQRSLSLPGAGLLAQCSSLRKLFIHGTANEHFMMFLLKIPNLRDVQLREDYYPAPENDTSTEMRKDSCTRFEDALNRRQIPD